MTTASERSPSLLSRARELCSRSALPRKYCPSSTTKGFSTTSLMRIMALLGDRIGNPLHTDREKIYIYQVFTELLGFKVLLSTRGMENDSDLKEQRLLFLSIRISYYQWSGPEFTFPFLSFHHGIMPQRAAAHVVLVISLLPGINKEKT